MNGQDNFSGVPQKTLERLAKKQTEISELEELIDERRNEIGQREDAVADGLDSKDPETGLWTITQKGISSAETTP